MSAAVSKKDDREKPVKRALQHTEDFDPRPEALPRITFLKVKGNHLGISLLLDEDYRISSINTASLIITAVWYYSNTNNIEFNVYFNSNAPSNNTAWQRKKQDFTA